MQADPALKSTTRGRLFCSYGHVFVVLAVNTHVPSLGQTGCALPVMFRLFEGPSPGGRDDAPSTSADEEAPPTTSATAQIGCEGRADWDTRLRAAHAPKPCRLRRLHELMR